MALIKAAVRHGRLTATDIIPGTVLHHFLYKSRANVQFVMPSYEPHFTTLLARRRFGSTIPQFSLQSSKSLQRHVKLTSFGPVMPNRLGCSLSITLYTVARMPETPISKSITA